MTETSTPASTLAPYLPRLVRAWSEETNSPRVRAVDGSLVSVDISGFTALAERLQTKGKAGAEELVTRISDVFDALIAVAERHGGDVLKFRGDALLLLFAGERHAERACGAASDMQWTIEAAGRAESSVGPVELRMSAGVHSEPCTFVLTHEPHRELLVAGPAATRVFQLEDLANAGEIVVSAETAAAIDPGWVGEERGGARLMTRLEPGASTIPPPPAVPGTDLHEYVPHPLRDHLAVASGEAEHRQVTVAFLKLPGTDELLANEGPDALLTRLDAVAAEVGRACATYGLTWLESDIDVGAVKLYLTGGAPSSSGDDEEGMVRALRDVIAACPDLGLRAGVNRGHVFTGDIGNPNRRTYAVMGDAVNLAARLTARAQPGRILATADVLDRASTIYQTETEPLLVKGKDQAVMAHAIVATMGQRPKGQPDTTPIVGRDAELERLRFAVDRARMRQLQVVELVGEPGIGKSRLVQELRTLAFGFQQLDAAAEHYSSSEPYAAFRALLRQLVGITPDRTREEAGTQLTPFVTGMMADLAPWLPLLAIPFDAAVAATPEADALDPGASRDRLHWAVETFLERILMMPTLIVVEDAHWLDDGSRFLLSHLAATPAPRPWLVCVTSRPGMDPLVGGDGPGFRLELEPLEGKAAEQLAIAVAEQWALSVDAVHTLAERSGGNPFFVRELVFAAQHGNTLESLPETVESLLTTRIDTLDPADRMLLRCAAVVGPAFGLDLLGEILETEIPGAGHPERWAYLGEFVVPAEGGALAFRHDLVRATAYEGLSFRRRRQIHGRVGEALERRAGAHAAEEAALLSLHFFEAGDHERAWRYSVLAGSRAEAGFANVVAAELYERALVAAAQLDHVQPEERAGVCESLGDVCDRFGGYERARAAFEQARALAAGDPLADARLLRKVGVTHERAGRYDDACAAHEQGLARLDEADPVEEAVAVRAALEHALAGTRYRQSRYDESLEHARRAIALAEQVGDLGAVAHASYIAGTAHDDLGLDGGVGYLERAVELYEQIRDDRGLSASYNNLGIHHYTQGRWDEAVRCYRRCREVDERIGDPVAGAVHANNEAEVLSDQGRLDEAEPLFQEMVRTCRAAAFPIGAALGTSNLGRVAARAGRFDEARALYEEAVQLFEQIGSRRYVTETQARIAEVLTFQGSHAGAFAAGMDCREEAKRTPFGGLEALIERTIGYALCQARRRVEATPHFEESLRIARALRAEFEIALTLRAMAAVGWEGAEGLRAESDAILERLGVVSVPRVPLP
jgi:class 3 adenylate cyclase/tetratricopeptide (TPR) repeat protein